MVIVPEPDISTMSPLLAAATSGHALGAKPQRGPLPVRKLIVWDPLSAVAAPANERAKSKVIPTVGAKSLPFIFSWPKPLIPHLSVVYTPDEIAGSRML